MRVRPMRVRRMRVWPMRVWRMRMWRMRVVAVRTVAVRVVAVMAVAVIVISAGVASIPMRAGAAVVAFAIVRKLAGVAQLALNPLRSSLLRAADVAREWAGSERLGEATDAACRQSWACGVVEVEVHFKLDLEQLVGIDLILEQQQRCTVEVDARRRHRRPWTS